MNCPNCHAWMGDDELFCGNCGARITTPAAPPPAAARPVTTRRGPSCLGVLGAAFLVLVLAAAVAVAYMFLQGQPPQLAQLTQLLQPAAPTAAVAQAQPPAPTLAPPPAAQPTVAPPTAAPPTAVPPTAAPPTAAPAGDLGVPVPAGWRLVLSETFDDNRNNWPEGTGDTEWVQNRLLFMGARYRWIASSHQAFEWYVWPDGMAAVSDFYASVEARQMSGTDDADYGLAFRISEDGTYYRFVVEETGQYYLTRLVDWVETPLRSWRPSDAVRTGEFNRITVIGQGEHLACYINDRLVAEVDDATIPSGRVALDIGFDAVGAVATVDYDNFVLYTP